MNKHLRLGNDLSNVWVSDIRCASHGCWGLSIQQLTWDVWQPMCGYRCLLAQYQLGLGLQPDVGMNPLHKDLARALRTTRRYSLVGWVVKGWWIMVGFKLNGWFINGFWSVWVVSIDDWSCYGWCISSWWTMVVASALKLRADELSSWPPLVLTMGVY